MLITMSHIFEGESVKLTSQNPWGCIHQLWLL